MPHLGHLKAKLRSENALQTITAHNENKGFSQQQYGGTFVAAFGELATRLTEMGKDGMGLGQWTWMCVDRTDGQKVQIITAYTSEECTI